MFHKSAVTAFNNMVFKDVYKHYDIVSDEKTIKETDEKTGHDVVHSGFEIKDQESKKTYFVPSGYVSEMPIKIRASKKVIYSRKVYHLVTRADSILIKPEKTMSVKSFVDSWFPLNSTSNDDLLYAKLLILNSVINQDWSRLCTKQGFGKDQIVNNLISLSGLGRKVSKASVAKLGQLTEEGYTAFNEIAGFGGSGEKQEIFQDFFLTTSDGNDVYEHETTGSNKTKSSYDISDYGYNILHNVPEYYISNGKPVFEQMFTPAVFYRIMPFMLRGQLKGNDDFINTNLDWDEFVKEHFNSYKDWVAMLWWIKDNKSKFTATYDSSSYPLEAEPGEETSRWGGTFNRLACLVSSYCEGDDAGFNYIMKGLYGRHKDYLEKVRSLGLIGGDE